MRRNPKTIKNDLLQSYLDSAGGFLELNSDDLKVSSAMMSLELWRVCPCQENPNRTHYSASCKRDVAVLTDKGVDVCKELIGEKIRDSAQQLKKMLEQTPPRILLFLLDTLNEAEWHSLTANTLPNTIVGSEKKLLNSDLYPFAWFFDYDLSKYINSCFFPIDVFVNSFFIALANSGLVKLNPSDHINKGWRAS